MPQSSINFHLDLDDWSDADERDFLATKYRNRNPHSMFKDREENLDIAEDNMMRAEWDAAWNNVED